MSIKILLADDSITIQKVVGIIFGGEEYTLTVVDNGKAAVEKARELNPDVLLIDALMPGMSGYEVCEAVRATPALAAKPILLLTGSFEPFDENKAKNCGADDFLAKPFESQQILTKVKELFDLGASRTGASTPAAALTVETEPAIPAFAEFQIETDAQPISDETAVTNDIWGAFTATDEPTAAAEASPVVSETAFDEDMFAMVSEEPEIPAAIVTSEPPASEGTGSLWIPVEEETFEFEEETAAEPPSLSFSEPEAVVNDSAFEMDIHSPKILAVETSAISEVPAPVFNEPEMNAFAEPAPVFFQQATPDVVPVETTIPATITEDQLRAVLAGASKEVIERIVWEIVPDLAEVMIKDAIRKIQDGK